MCGEFAEMAMTAIKCGPCWRRNEKERYVIAGPAQRLVAKAIRKGLLPKLDGSVMCVDCGKPAQVYDHREYAKPLEVDPVCKRCNVRRGPAKEVAPLWRKPFASRRCDTAAGPESCG